MTHTVVAVLIIIAVGAIVIAAGIITLVYSQSHRKGRQYKFRLELSNEGNVASRFELQAAEPSGLLSFQFAANGTPLGQRQGARLGGAAKPAAAAAPAVAPAGGGGLKEKTASAMGASSAIANVLMTIGYVLPSSLGMPLINLGSQMRYGEYAADRVSQIPGQVQRMGQIGQSSGGTYVPGSNMPLPPSSVAQAAASADGVVQPAMISWAPTPLVASGASLALDLIVEPANASVSQRCPFTVSSRAVDDLSAQTNVEQGDVRLEGLSAVQKFLPWAVFAVVAIAVTLFGAFFIVSYQG